MRKAIRRETQVSAALVEQQGNAIRRACRGVVGGLESLEVRQLLTTVIDYELKEGNGTHIADEATAGGDQYMTEPDAGRHPNRQAFLARHPAIADDLAARLHGLSFVQSAAAQIRRSTDGVQRDRGSPGIDLAAAQPLGDFKLVREIGRGGMGVVYEAVQLSLDRRVAVKVLSMAGALDPRHLKRFRNEAQAAQLHHTNIVPVYAVGCERSVHFYAMQLIEDQSLAHVIEELRSLARDARHGDLHQRNETVHLTGGRIRSSSSIREVAVAPKIPLLIRLCGPRCRRRRSRRCRSCVRLPGAAPISEPWHSLACSGGGARVRA